MAEGEMLNLFFRPEHASVVEAGRGHSQAKVLSSFASAVGHMDLEPFKRRDDLRRLIQRHPQVERLTCGHSHRSITLRFGGNVATV